MRAFSVFNAVLGCLFAVVFGAFVLAPESAERHLKQEVVRRLSADVVARYPSLARAAAVQKLALTLESEAKRLRESVDENPLAEAVYQQVRSLCRYDCDESRPEWRWARASLAHHFRVLRIDVEQLQLFAAQSYSRRMEKLIADVRIFSASNAVLFLLAALVSWRGRGSWGLTLLSVSLSLASLIGVGCYLFQQNWLHALLFSRFVGYSYFSWVVLLAVWLCAQLVQAGRGPRMAPP